MSIFQRVFKKLEDDRAARQRQLEKNYAGLCETIVAQVTGNDKSDEDTIAGYVEDCIHAGIATPAKIQELHDAAVRLHGHIQASEVPPVDAEAAEVNYRRVCDEAHAAMAAAGQAMNQAREANIARSTARQYAQRVVNDYPELACMFQNASWQPRIAQAETAEGNAAPAIIEVEQNVPVAPAGKATKGK